MARKTTGKDETWLSVWLDNVAKGRASMSQRALSGIEKHGGLNAAKRAARARRVHLLIVTDEAGRKLVAAGREAFIVVC